MSITSVTTRIFGASVAAAPTAGVCTVVAAVVPATGASAEGNDGKLDGALPTAGAEAVGVAPGAAVVAVATADCAP